MHDHAGTVLKPQIAAVRRAETGLARALRVSATKIAYAGELVDRTGRADFLNPAAWARDGPDKSERIGLPLKIEGATAVTHASDKVLGDRDIAGGRQTRNVLRGWGIHHPGAAGHCEHSRHKRRAQRPGSTIKRCFCHIGKPPAFSGMSIPSHTHEIDTGDLSLCIEADEKAGCIAARKDELY